MTRERHSAGPGTGRAGGEHIPVLTERAGGESPTRSGASGEKHFDAVVEGVLAEIAPALAAAIATACEDYIAARDSREP